MIDRGPPLNMSRPPDRFRRMRVDVLVVVNMLSPAGVC